MLPQSYKIENRVKMENYSKYFWISTFGNCNIKLIFWAESNHREHLQSYV